jgi:VWFA-related protein
MNFRFQISNFKLFSILFLLVFYSFANAQDDVIKVETNLVAFEVTVTDKDGKPVRNLQKDDFKLFENNEEREIDFFEQLKKSETGRPLAVVFALDVSGSMTNEELLKLRNSLKQFTDNLADYNSYFAIMSFGMEVKTLQSFTNKPEKLEKSFNKLLKDRDGLSTHAYDATDDAIRLIKRKSPNILKGKFPKRAVILITDGFPVGDTVSPKTVIERANDNETSIYTIIIPSFSRLQGNKKPLPTPLEVSGLVEKTGGKSLYANAGNFEPIFKALAEEITASYVLAIYPKVEKGKQAKIRIEARKGLQTKQNRTTYIIPN